MVPQGAVHSGCNGAVGTMYLHVQGQEQILQMLSSLGQAVRKP